MATYHELDALSSQELHDRAMSRAKRHLDVRFFWHLIEMIPVARAAKGDLEDAEQEIAHPSAQIANAVAEDPKLIDSLRPFYLEYLSKHAAE